MALSEPVCSGSGVSIHILRRIRLNLIKQILFRAGQNPRSNVPIVDSHDST